MSSQLKFQFFCFILLYIAAISAAPQQQPEVNSEFGDRGFSFEDSKPTKEETDIDGANGRATCVCVDPQNCRMKKDQELNRGAGLLDVRNDFAADPVCSRTQMCCKHADILNGVTTTPPPIPDNRGCGYRNVGGLDPAFKGKTPYESDFGEFPWAIALLHITNSKNFASGSLIHPRIVLTAAHSVQNKTPLEIIIRAGEWDAHSVSEPLAVQDRRVSKIIMHPNFEDLIYIHDFALLILESPLPLTAHINTICLPPENGLPLAGTTCLSSGWGKHDFGPDASFSVVLKRIPLPIIPFNACQNKLRTTRVGETFSLDRSFVCAGGEIGIDNCLGDGGSALACPTGPENQLRYEQTGITSWGIGCKNDNPGVYASIPTARKWIDEQVIANGFDPSSYMVA